MVGVAPGASLASWVIFDTNSVSATDEQLMDMYSYASNIVSVQNHSWGHGGLTLNGVSVLEQAGIASAINQGRSGRGVVMVRSAGNDRPSGANADDNGYPSDPRVIAVAAVRMDGRVASYSNPGACVLVGAPSGDSPAGFYGLLTTDLLGTDGVNWLNYYPPYQDMNGYVWFSLGFSGTSAAAPQIAGVAALILSANPDLTYRDVQQILILSSRHFDFADPDLTTNGAGFLVSHNVGFGVPDAGVAVSLAQNWINRPSPTNVTMTITNPAAIPDDGLRVLITGSDVPANLMSIHTLPSTGPHADTPTAALPLVDFGFGTNTGGINLTNSAALIQRDDATTFATKINAAAQVGAAFAIVYNYVTNESGSGAPGGDQLMPMGVTDFVPIPAVFIGNSDGEALKALFQTNATALAQIHLDTTNYVFSVTNALLCEHVGLRVMTDHPLRGDVRITLVSPAGTRSVLQRYNADESPGPVDWTYYSTHHFFESSAGNWTACFSDEGAGNTGTVYSVSLSLDGVRIHDRDKDGLDDYWEITYADSLSELSPKDDPDHDGYSNMREQLMDTDPTVAEEPLLLDLSRWNQSLGRLSWPGSPYFSYEVWGGTDVNSLSLLATLPGHFPVMEWFAPYGSQPSQFFRVRAVANP
jgi:subtilisin-like proprotein convertase family protein